MVYFGAYGPMRPEEQAALRRPDVTLEPLSVKVRDAAPELTTGRRVEGDTKSAAGRRTVFLPAFLYIEVKRHLDWYAEKEPDGLLFVGEGRPLPPVHLRPQVAQGLRSGRPAGGIPLLIYDLRYTGHTLSTQSGATLKDTMVRAGQSSEKAALIYQHSDDGRQAAVAEQIDARVRDLRRQVAEKAAGRDR